MLKTNLIWLITFLVLFKPFFNNYLALNFFFSIENFIYLSNDLMIGFKGKIIINQGFSIEIEGNYFECPT